MTRICKMTLAAFLAVILTFGAALAVFASSPQFIILDPPAEATCTFTTDKDRYAWGDTITFTVEVTNVSENVLYDVRVAPDLRHPQWFTIVTSEDDCMIGTLEPEEKASVQIVIGTQTLSLQDRFLVLVRALHDRLTDDWAYAYSMIFKVNYPGKRYNTVRIGAFDQGIDFDVYYTNIMPALN